MMPFDQNNSTEKNSVEGTVVDNAETTPSTKVTDVLSDNGVCESDDTHQLPAQGHQSETPTDMEQADGDYNQKPEETSRETQVILDEELITPVEIGDQDEQGM